MQVALQLNVGLHKARTQKCTTKQQTREGSLDFSHLNKQSVSSLGVFLEWKQNMATCISHIPSQAPSAKLNIPFQLQLSEIYILFKCLSENDSSSESPVPHYFAFVFKDTKSN